MTDNKRGWVGKSDYQIMWYLNSKIWRRTQLTSWGGALLVGIIRDGLFHNVEES